jgi:hypothetical protein
MRTTPARDTDELPVAAAAEELGGPGAVGGSVGTCVPDRRAVRDARRRTRRLRRLYALGGLLVIAAFLAATIVVVDMVR